MSSPVLDRAKIRLAGRAWRLGKIAAGLCVRCKLPTLPGKRTCARHRQTEAQKHMSLRAVDGGRACPLRDHWCQDEAAMTLFRRLYTSGEAR